MVLVNACPVCFIDKELVDNLLLKCRFTQRMWSAMLGWFGCNWVVPEYLCDLFEAWMEVSIWIA